MSGYPLIGLPVLVLFVATPVLLASAVSSRFGGELRGLARPMAGFVTAVTFLIAIVVTTGAIGVLHLPVVGTILAAFAVASIAILLSDRRRTLRAKETRGASPIGGSPEPGDEADHVNAALIVPAGDRTRAALLAMGFVAAVATAGTAIVRGWRGPAVAYDALMYHLVFPAEWIRQGALVYVPTYFAAPANSYFPSNTEAMMAYLMMAVGDDRLAGLVQAPFLIAGAFALAGIARRCGLGLFPATCAAVVFAGWPEVASQAGSGLVDVVFAASVLMALLFILELAVTGSRAAAVCAGLSLGILGGTKSLGLVFGALIAIVAALALHPLWRRGRPALARAGMIAAAPLPLGSFWYLRNAIATGNPFFPVSIEPGGITIFSGAHGRGEMLASVFHVPPLHAETNALVQLWGPSPGPIPLGPVPLVVPLMLLLFAACIPTGLRTLAGGVEGRATRLAVVLLPLPMILVFSRLNPYNTQYRFLLPAFALSLLVIVAAAAHGNSMARLVPGALIAVLLLAVALWGRGGDPRLEVNAVSWIWLLPATGAAILAASRPALPDAVLRLLRGRLPLAFSSAAIVLAVLQPAVARDYSVLAGSDRDGQRARVWARIGKLATPRVVAYTGMNQPYPFYGRDLSNHVLHVPVDGRVGANLHDYLETAREGGSLRFVSSYKPAYYRQRPDRDNWLRALGKQGVDTLVVSRLLGTDQQEFPHDGDGWPEEYRWAGELPDHFVPLVETADMAVFEVKSDRTDADPEGR